MPKLKIGENEFHEFPYDPDIIAGLMFKGLEVFPDEGVGGLTKRLHEQEINSRLKKCLTAPEIGKKHYASHDGARVS